MLESSASRVAGSFAVLARELATHKTREEALAAVVHSAVGAIPGAEDASLTVQRTDGRYLTIAATSDLPLTVDNIQYETGEGPSLASISDHHVSVSDDLRTEQRWPLFTRRAAAETDVLSILAHRLFLEDDTTMGSLNLYSTKPAAFNDDSLVLLNVYATHCAIALARVTESEQSRNLQAALESNRDIGVAMGILMNRYRITKQDAFDVLRMASQNGHRKLRAVALEVIDTGSIELPDWADEPGRRTRPTNPADESGRRLGAVACPLGMERAFPVDSLIGVGSEVVPQSLDQRGG
jgi:hypothetical protein